MATLLLSVVALGGRDIIAGTVRSVDNEVVKTKLASALPPVKLTHNLSANVQIRSEKPPCLPILPVMETSEAYYCLAVQRTTHQFILRYVCVLAFNYHNTWQYEDNTNTDWRKSLGGGRFRAASLCHARHHCGIALLVLTIHDNTRCSDSENAKRSDACYCV